MQANKYTYIYIYIATDDNFFKYIYMYIYPYISKNKHIYTCIHIQQVIGSTMGNSTATISANLFLHYCRS